jgi:hypothetical protein
MFGKKPAPDRTTDPWCSICKGRREPVGDGPETVLVCVRCDRPI